MNAVLDDVIVFLKWGVGAASLLALVVYVWGKIYEFKMKKEADAK